MRISAVSRLAVMTMLCFISFLLAVFGAFLTPVTPVPGVSVGVVLAVVGNYLLVVRARAASGTALGAALPAVVWLVVALTLAGSRSEGDVVLTNSAASLGFLILGAMASAVGIGRRPPPAPNDSEAAATEGEEEDDTGQNGA